MKDFLVTTAWTAVVAVLVLLAIAGVLELLDRRPTGVWVTVVVGVSVAVASLVAAIGDDVRDVLRRNREEREEPGL